MGDFNTSPDLGALLNALTNRVRDLERRHVTGFGGAEASWHTVGDPGEPAYSVGWSAIPSHSAKFIRLAGFVYLSGEVLAGVGAGQSIFTLPEGYRPGLHIGVTIANFNDAHAVPLAITSDGQVLLSAAPTVGHAFSLVCAPFSVYG